MNSNAFRHCRAAVALALTLILCPVPSSGWGTEGHIWINQLAAQSLPDSMPKFLKKAKGRLGYLGPEPDRWRDVREAALKHSQEPDHYIDLERVDWLKEFPQDRYEFYRLLYEKRATAANPDDLLPQHVGLQPYIVAEIYGRLKVGFREYRKAKAEHRPTEGIEQNIVYYAGWLGHYVADGSQPLHTTVAFDGWVGPNPNGYTTEKGIHWKFEGTFVKDNIKPEDLKPYLKAVRRLNDPFNDYLHYLRGSHERVEKLYQLDKAKAFDGGGTPEGRRFAAEDMAAGVQMLANLWYTAWLESEQIEAPKPVGALRPVQK